MIKDKNYASLAYKKSVKLEKEKLVKDNYLYSEKIQKFSLPKISISEQFTKTYSFNCEEGSILFTDINAKFSNDISFEFLINGIPVISKNCNEIRTYNMFNVTNTLVCDIKLTPSTNTQIEDFCLKICGKIKRNIKSEKRLIKGNNAFIQVLNKNCDRFFYSEYQNFNDFKSGINIDYIDANISNLLDVDYVGEGDSSNFISEPCYLYKNGGLQLKVGNLVTEVSANNVDEACVGYLKSDAKKCVVAFLENNDVTIKEVDENGAVAQVDFAHNLKSQIKTIGSFVNTTRSTLNGFYMLTSNQELYLTFRASANSDYSKLFNCGKCEDCSVYIAGSYLYVFMFKDNCLTLQVYDLSINAGWQNFTRVAVKKFYNCEQGVVNNGMIYVISDDRVIKVEIE